MIRTYFCKVVLIAALMAPGTASADLISFWVAGKGSTISGTCPVFENMDNKFAGGVEAGLELLGLELMGEAFILGSDQHMFTGNLGMDFGIDLGVRLNLGAYAGVVVFSQPEPKNSGINIPDDVSSQLGEDGDMLAAQIESAYNDSYGAQASELEKYAFGGQLRLRVQVDYELISFLYLGIEGSAAYHLMFEGSDVTATAKDRAIDEALSNEAYDNIPEDVRSQLKQAVGAESTDASDLNGVNYNAGVYLKLEF